MIATAIASGMRRIALAARARIDARQRLALHVLHDQEELASSATTSSVGTTLGWRMRAARRASSRNIDTNSGSAESRGASA